MDDSVIDVVDDEWRKDLYNLKTAEEISEHIGYNLIINDLVLSQLDGWADQPDTNAEIIFHPNWDIKSVEIFEEEDKS